MIYSKLFTNFFFSSACPHIVYILCLTCKQDVGVDNHREEFNLNYRRYDSSALSSLE